eukprot:m.246699 g.246699  ORF g.246699 m.246699 type:complete len:447 (-) comp54474_c0_seq1:107-1447(-)
MTATYVVSSNSHFGNEVFQASNGLGLWTTESVTSTALEANRAVQRVFREKNPFGEPKPGMLQIEGAKEYRDALGLLTLSVSPPDCTTWTVKATLVHFDSVDDQRQALRYVRMFQQAGQSTDQEFQEESEAQAQQELLALRQYQEQLLFKSQFCRKRPPLPQAQSFDALRHLESTSDDAQGAPAPSVPQHEIEPSAAAHEETGVKEASSNSAISPLAHQDDEEDDFDDADPSRDDDPSDENFVDSDDPGESGGEDDEHSRPRRTKHAQSNRDHPSRERALSKPKKDPNAPKGFVTAYNFFVQCKRVELVEQNPGITTTEVMYKAAALWRELSLQDRTPYKAMADRDRERVLRDRAAYDPSSVQPKKRMRRDPDAPKRPMSAFLYFANEFRPKLSAENPGYVMTELSKRLASMWASLSDVQKAPYFQTAHEAKLRQREAMIEYQSRLL